MSTIEQPPQQQGPYAYGPPPQWQPQQARPQSNGIATGGFVTALVGAVIALIPLLGIISWLICPVGLVLSVVGVVMANKRGGVGRGMAIAGAILAVVGLVICSAYAAAFSNAVNGSRSISSASSGSSSYSAPSYSAPSYSAPGYASPSFASDAPATASGPLRQVTSGTYEVGTGDGQVAPGKYVASAGSSSCYYARLRDMDGGLNSIIDNHAEYRGGQVILTIKSSDQAVEVSGDCTFAKK